MDGIGIPQTTSQTNPRVRRPVRTEDELRRHHGYRALAHFDGRWHLCIAACRRHGTCSGGARGTFLRRGRPRCWRPADEAEMPKPIHSGAPALPVEPISPSPSPQPVCERQEPPHLPDWEQIPEPPKTIRATVVHPASLRADSRPENDPASAILELLRHPLDDDAKKELKVQLAALREQGALMRARSEALAEQRRRERKG